jgi:hypothetical protein
MSRGNGRSRLRKRASQLNSTSSNSSRLVRVGGLVAEFRGELRSKGSTSIDSEPHLERGVNLVSHRARSRISKSSRGEIPQCTDMQIEVPNDRPRITSKAARAGIQKRGHLPEQRPAMSKSNCGLEEREDESAPEAGLGAPIWEARVRLMGVLIEPQGSALQ